MCLQVYKCVKGGGIERERERSQDDRGAVRTGISWVILGKLSDLSVPQFSISTIG